MLPALANIEQLLGKARLGVSHRDWHTYAKNQQRGANKEAALQVHRFYTAMQYGDDVYGVKMTVREKQNGSTVFYTLEAHDMDIEKINPETESSRGGVVKAALPGRSPAIKFNTFFEKFKPIDDLLGFKYKEKYPRVRFSIIGELGAFGLDGNLRQNNLSNLHTAKEMSAAGKDAKTISGKDEAVKEGHSKERGKRRLSTL